MTDPRTVIVGGGPAGALAALRLAASGRDVVLFHDDRRPEKPCGGGIPWRGLERVPELLDEALPRRVVRRFVALAPSGRRLDFELDAPVHVFARARLDGHLRRRAVEAGARLVPRHVRDVRPDAGRFRITDETGEVWHATRVVGADGAGSRVRRTFLGRRPVPALSQAVGGYVDGITDDRLIVSFMAGLQGYGWCFPRPDHLAIGVCAPLGAARAAALHAHCRRLVSRLPEELAVDPRSWRPYAAVIPAPLHDRAGRVVVEGDGWALLGDAAGAVDPLTREGLHYALETADLYASAVVDPAGGTYTERFERHFPAELRWASRHAADFFTPGFTERLVHYADVSPAVRRVLGDLVSGRQSYRTLKRRLLSCALPLAISLAASRWRRPRSRHASGLGKAAS